MWVALCWTDEDQDQLQCVQGPFPLEVDVVDWAERESVSNVTAEEVQPID
jgi:hypothetical protein